MKVLTKKTLQKQARLSGDVYTVEHSERGRESHAAEHPPQGLPGPVQRVLRERRRLVGRGIPKALKLKASLRVWFSRVNAWGGVVYPHKARGAFMHSNNVTSDVTPEATSGTDSLLVLRRHVRAQGVSA